MSNIVPSNQAIVKLMNHVLSNDVDFDYDLPGEKVIEFVEVETSLTHGDAKLFAVVAWVDGVKHEYSLSVSIKERS